MVQPSTLTVRMLSARARLQSFEKGMWVNWSPVIEAAVVAPLLGLPGATRGHDRGKVRKGWASPL